MNTREIALISIFSAIWLTSQILVGPIAHTSTLHGLVQRFMGWFLMLILAEFTGKFGRVSLMAALTALATRLIRYSPDLYIWTVGLGYALGGLAFDALFFAPLARSLKRVNRTGYLAVGSLVSGVVAIVPYILFRLTSLTFIAFMIWLPTYIPRAFVDVGLNVLGTITALPLVPKIKASLPTLQVGTKT